MVFINICINKFVNIKFKCSYKENNWRKCFYSLKFVCGKRERERVNICFWCKYDGSEEFYIGND